MKVLIFSVTPAGYSHNTVLHNGGGWIESFVRYLHRENGLQLGVSFEGDGIWGDQQNEITYYPIDVFSKRKNKLLRRLSYRLDERLLLPEIHRAITDFNPDLIHIFGSENAFGCITKEIDIPCIIHLQGFLPSYYNAKFPPGISRTIGAGNWLRHPLRSCRSLRFDRVFRHRAKREEEIVRNCSNFFGRTAWDRDIVEIYHPEAAYWYCSELLRPEFYEAAGSWTPHDRREIVLVSVLSAPIYKGHDLVLKTAAMLKRYTNLPFRWRIFGGFDDKFWKKRLGIAAQEVHVESGGVVSAQQLCKDLLAADIFVHPSYIDNSPNSVCEAQLLGMPVIATDVGGIRTLVSDGKNGFLIPANDPVSAAARIKQLWQDRQLAEALGHEAAGTAAERHAPSRIAADVCRAYHALVGGEEA